MPEKARRRKRVVGFASSDARTITSKPLSLKKVAGASDRLAKCEPPCQLGMVLFDVPVKDAECTSGHEIVLGKICADNFTGGGVNVDININIR